MIAFILPGDNLRLFKATDRKLNVKLKHSLIAGYVEKKTRFGDRVNPGLTAENSFMKFTISTEYGGEIEDVQLTRDLNGHRVSAYH